MEPAPWLLQEQKSSLQREPLALLRQESPVLLKQERLALLRPLALLLPVPLREPWLERAPEQVWQSRPVPPVLLAAGFRQD